MPSATQAKSHKYFFIFAGLLAVVLGVLFWKSFLPEYVVFSNDGPFGGQDSWYVHLPAAFVRCWQDLTLIGSNVGGASPDIGNLIKLILTPLGYAKFVAPIGLWILGVSAWFFFRRAGLSPLAAGVGGFAACLATNFYSNACWGAVPPIIAFGMDFLALGAMIKRDNLPRWAFWVVPALAGFAVGINVMEAADIGALFSLLVAAFIVYQSIFIENGSPLAGRVARGAGRTIIVAAFAFFIAIYTVGDLFTTSVSGVNGGQQQSTAARWGFATQWSLPKRETLTLFIPGLFGDRVDFPDQRMYWGGMGRDISWDAYYHQELKPNDSVTIAFPEAQGQRISPQIDSNGEIALPSVGSIKAAGLTRFELQKKLNGLYAPTPLKSASIVFASGFQRHTGRGFYLGLMVVLLGLWAALQSLRKTDSVFTPTEKKFIWFWSVVFLVALALAHGRFSPFEPLYYWIYSALPLPPIRNPDKFLHIVCFAAVILFGYGVDGLNRRYLATSLSNLPLGERIKNWWARAATFDRRWMVGMAFAIVLGFVGWAIYGALRPAVVQYMQDTQVPDSATQPLAHEIAAHSFWQVGWFLLFLVINAVLLLLIFSGAFAGRRAKIAGFLLGVILVADLAHADLQYANPFKEGFSYGFWNYKEKYETDGPNPVVDETHGPNPIAKFLADKPYEHRVAELPFGAPPQLSMFNDLYSIEWNQQIFEFYNIETLDIVQFPRMPQDLQAFELAQAFPDTPPWTRLWQLTNTRYLLGPSFLVDEMNRQLDPQLHRFRILNTFRVEPRLGVANPTYLAEWTAVPDPNGEYAIIEFTGALPRAKLYSTWETNSPADLRNFTTTGLSPVEQQAFQLVGTNANDFLTLKKLMSPSFDPTKAVLLSKPVAALPNSAATNQNAGEVSYVSYWPTDIKLKANATTPSVLLLNDKYDPYWQVWVDGKRAELLKCNFIMRGVFLQPGNHDVEFRFRPPVNMLYVTLSAIAMGIVLLGYVSLAPRKENEQDAPESVPLVKAAGK